MQNMRYLQSEVLDKGKLRVDVTTVRESTPIEDAKIEISYEGDPEQSLEEVNTDESGQTEMLELNTPPLEYSMEPSERQPFAQYSIRVTAEGFRPVTVTGIEVFSEQTSVQKIRMERENAQENRNDTITIPIHTLFGDYPPKIAESEIKPIAESGEIVLSRVVVPEYVIVHDGAPNDPTASDYYVRYRDYIKNVASSEIYSTWPDATLRANILAIMSFTMNRVYTEW